MVTGVVLTAGDRLPEISANLEPHTAWTADPGPKRGDVPLWRPCEPGTGPG